MASSKTEVLVEYNHVGKSGLKVSNICLGTLTFGRVEDSHNTLFDLPTQAEEEKAHQLMDRFKELGGNYLDTANVYSYGQSEQIVGSWLKKQNRDNIIVSSKVRFPMGDDPNNVGLSRRHIIKSCEDSLQRLHTHYIDLFQSHIWDNATHIEETLRTFDDLVRCGKIRYVGVSNLLGWQMQKVVDLVKQMGLNPVISLQQQYHLLERHPEFEELQVCRNEGIAVLSWSPLKGGLLTDKYKRETSLDVDIGRIAYVSKYQAKISEASPSWSKYFDSEFYWNLRSVMENIGKKHGKSTAQVALRWILQKDVVASVIIGVTSQKQLEDNLATGCGWSLSKEEMERLDEASKPDVPYPYGMSRAFNTTRFNKYLCHLYNRLFL